MNKIFNIVWCKALRQPVVTSELGRRSVGGSAPRSARSLRTPVLSLTALAAALLLVTPAHAVSGGLSMPGGAILDINNGTAPNSASNTPDTFQTYSVTFTATTTGNNYILFAFREDPAFWTFGNVGLYAAGDTSTNLFTNPLFTQGGAISGTSNVQAPANWGVAYQANTQPEAAGTWKASGTGEETTTNVNENGAGSWYDGAVGSFDGIYQGVDLVAGTTYTISFTALANDAADTAGTGSDTEMGVYQGTCITLTGPAANCKPDNPGFDALATPGDAANAGGPSVVQITAPMTVTSLGAAAGAFDGGTLLVDQNTTTVSQDFTISSNGGAIDQQGNTSTFTGVISDGVSGTPGSIAVINSGTGGSVTFTGANTYTGHTSIGSGATLALAGDGSIASSDGVTDNGSFDIHQANGDGSIATLGGNGTVVLGSNHLDITNGHDSFSGGIEGTGGVNISGGTQAFTGSSSYTGGTTVTGGATVSINNGNALGTGTITLDGGNLTATQSLSIDRDMQIGANNAFITTLDGVTLNAQGDMSGTGGLIKLGGGTLVVSGNNSFTGGTLIQGGVISIDSGSSLGTGAILLQGGMLETAATLGTGQQVVISGDSGINVDANTTTVLSGSLAAAAGDGCFTKTGAGKLSLTGSASMASGICVQEGMLSANGYLDSSFVDVDAAAMLRGVGMIVGPVNVAGVLAPGNSPGTLAVLGSVTMQAGSTLEIDIDGQGTANGAGNYSRVLVGGAGNQFVANGTLAPTLRGITGDASNTYTPAIGSMYRIVTADGGIVGQFASLAQPTSGLANGTRFLAFYRTNAGHSIDLTVAPTSYAGYIGAAARRNGLAAATALDGSMLALDAGTATTAQTSLLYAVSPLSGDRLAAMAKSLSGEIHADEAAAAREAGLGMQRDITDHLGTDIQGADAAHKVWANVTQDGNRSIADGQGSGFQSNTGRTTAGIDLYAESGTVLGVAATNHDTSVLAQGGSGSIRGNSGMLYAQQAVGSFLLDGVAAFGSTDWTTRRADPLGGTMLESRASGKDAMASATLRLPIQTTGSNRIEPYASVIWQKVERDGTSERGISAATLSLDELSQKGTRVLAGVTMGSKAADPLATTLTWRAGIAAGVDTGDLLDPTVHNTLAGQGFDTAAPGVGRGFVQVNANGTMRLGKSTYLYGGLTAEEGQRRAAYGVTAGLRVSI